MVSSSGGLSAFAAWCGGKQHTRFDVGLQALQARSLIVLGHGTDDGSLLLAWFRKSSKWVACYL
jgi:hypothetical protein